MALRVLHILQALSDGGASRALFALTKYLGADFQHTALSIAPNKLGRQTEKLAAEHKVTHVVSRDLSSIHRCISEADVVLVHWWNNPELGELFSQQLPAARYVGWFHVGGHVSPQIITDEVIDFFDVAVACSPHTFASPSFMTARKKRLVPEIRMVYGPADFARVEGVSPIPHQGFNIGYVGTVDFLKMHRDFVSLSSSVKIPQVKFIVCGTGGAEAVIKSEAAAQGVDHQFELRGYVEDIRPVLASLDVYGYPLCPENYSGSELNLQEVMKVGIPPVVFSYGGVSKLVINGYTGLVVESAEEYTRALEYLYNNPDERVRLGRNARNYAEQVFGAEHAAHEFRRIFDFVMTLTKKPRTLEPSCHIEVAEILGSDPNSGVVRMIASLGDAAEPFLVSAGKVDISDKVAADEKIRGASALLRDSALLQYADYYSNEPLLRFWYGLALLGSRRYQEAVPHLTHAWNMGMHERRLLWYITEANALLNNSGIAL